MSERDVKRDFFSALENRGLLDYGSVIPTAVVHELLELKFPEVAPKSVYDRLAMVELAAIDYCRNILLGRGKYLAGTREGYRILLPGENKTQIDNYMQSADRKLSRALKLSRNTPDDKKDTADQTQARLLMKREGMRRYSSNQQVSVGA